MSRLFVWLGAIILFASVCWLFPLFHVVPLKQAEAQKTAATFNPTQFAERLWRERLPSSLDQAVPCDVLLPAINANAGEARKKYSRILGVSDSYTFFVAGKGRVLSVSEDEIGVAVTDGAVTPEILIPVGLLFGNAIRDGTGLLNVNDYPNSQDFNSISEALNHLVETEVLPKLRGRAKVGLVVRFTGCAEVNDESSDLKPLRVVPIQAEVQ